MRYSRPHDTATGTSDTRSRPAPADESQDQHVMRDETLRAARQAVARLVAAGLAQDNGLRNREGGAMAEFEQSRDMGAAPEAVWRLVSDPRRVADWVPTAASSQAAGQGGVQLRGESHGHGYDTRGGFVADAAARRLTWDSPHYQGYRGALTVTGRGAGSQVTLQVTIPDVPPGADAELARGLSVTLDRIDQLTRALRSRFHRHAQGRSH